MINSTDDLRTWFLQSGVAAPLHTCIGPLPQSKASVARWTCDHADPQILHVSPHPDCYRLALLLAPLDARIWADRSPIWGGVVAADRFRLSAPGESIHWSRASGCDIANLFIPVELVERLSVRRGEEPGHMLTVPSFTADRMVLDSMHKMLDARVLAGDLASDACDSLVHLLTCYLLEHYARPPAHKEHEGLSGARLRKVLRHIANTACEGISNAQLAALCHMSNAHFSREFRRAVGLPPHQYVMKLRLERACIALQNSEAPIGDIAYNCGFHNASHFSRTFASHYGVTPIVFRQLRRRQDESDGRIMQIAPNPPRSAH